VAGVINLVHFFYRPLTITITMAKNTFEDQLRNICHKNTTTILKAAVAKFCSEKSPTLVAAFMESAASVLKCHIDDLDTYASLIQAGRLTVADANSLKSRVITSMCYIYSVAFTLNATGPVSLCDMAKATHLLGAVASDYTKTENRRKELNALALAQVKRANELHSGIKVDYLPEWPETPEAAIDALAEMTGGCPPPAKRVKQEAEK
jgi:hypothetical protein